MIHTSTISGAVAAMMEGETGLRWSLLESSQDLVAETIPAILQCAFGSESTERGMVQYPAILVYCERMTNSGHEKFASVSGTAHVVIEIRVSREGIVETQAVLDAYIDAVLHMLHNHRGQIADGLQYSGTYDVSFLPARRGGRNFTQTAKVHLQLTMHCD